MKSKTEYHLRLYERDGVKRLGAMKFVDGIGGKGIDMPWKKK